jgi:hypothetical protein
MKDKRRLRGFLGGLLFLIDFGVVNVFRFILDLALEVGLVFDLLHLLPAGLVALHLLGVDLWLVGGRRRGGGQLQQHFLLGLVVNHGAVPGCQVEQRQQAHPVARVRVHADREVLALLVVVRARSVDGAALRPGNVVVVVVVVER